MKTRYVLLMKIAKAGYIVMSVVFCIVGVMLVVSPEISALMIGRTLGAAMILFGFIKLIGYFSKDLFRLAFQYDLQLGALLIVLGLIMLLKPDRIMSFIFIAFGISILADGMFKVQIAIDSRRFGIRRWWVIMILAVITAVIALAMIFSPWESAELIVSILGVSLFAEGILNLCVAVSTVKIVKNQQPDVIEYNYFNDCDKEG